MARFYLDECMSKELQRELQGLGHDAVHCRDLGYGKHPDYLQLLHAYRDNRVLVTKDQTHFDELHGALVSWANEWKAPVVHRGILTVPDLMPNHEIAGKIHQLVDGRKVPMEGRFYDLPLHADWVERQVQSQRQP